MAANRDRVGQIALRDPAVRPVLPPESGNFFCRRYGQVVTQPNGVWSEQPGRTIMGIDVLRDPIVTRRVRNAVERVPEVFRLMREHDQRNVIVLQLIQEPLL